MTLTLKMYAMYGWYWFKNVALALDQLLNTLLWGDPDETLSRRAGRSRDKGVTWGCWLCSWLDKVDPRHCQKTLDRLTDEEGVNSVAQLMSRWKAANLPRKLKAGKVPA